LHRKLTEYFQVYLEFQHLTDVNACGADSWPKSKICLKVWTWSQCFKTKTIFEISALKWFCDAILSFQSSPLANLLHCKKKPLKNSLKLPKTAQNKRQINENEQIAEDYDSLVGVCCFIFSRRQHAHKHAIFCCYAAHAASSVFLLFTILCYRYEYFSDCFYAAAL
jgi:hypothetical protein